MIIFPALENIALNQPVSVSSQIDDVDVDASYVVDGNPSSNLRIDGCAHSLDSNNPWLTIDFGEMKTVIGVDIVNRGDCCGKCILSISDFIHFYVNIHKLLQ